MELLEMTKYWARRVLLEEHRQVDVEAISTECTAC